MRTKLGSLVLASAVVIALAGATDASAKSCGSVNVDLSHGSEGGAQNIKATNISCSEARKVARRCVKGTKRSSWNVRMTDSGRFILKSGSRKVTYTAVGGGGCANLMGE